MMHASAVDMQSCAYVSFNKRTARSSANAGLLTTYGRSRLYHTGLASAPVSIPSSI